MQQTPAHELHNPDLLKVIPKDANYLIEVGCSSGALAREFKKLSPSSRYVGFEIDENYASLAKRYCDEVIHADIETIDDATWGKFEGADCFIFGDTLEHLKDPWRILKKIRTLISPQGAVVCCIPNAQHWSLQVKLNIGDFRYQENGLLDRTHLRWFTRQTMIELFKDTGFEVNAIYPRIFNEPQKEKFLPLLKKIAEAAGINAEVASLDSLALQYVVVAKIKN